MKVAPLSADLLLKLALIAGAGVGAWLLVQRLRDGLPSLPDWQLPSVSWANFNPASDQNVAYQAANGVVSAVTGRDETLGGWFYSATHPDPMAPPAYVPWEEGYPTGGSVTSPIGGPGGAAFGIYPR